MCCLFDTTTEPQYTAHRHTLHQIFVAPRICSYIIYSLILLYLANAAAPKTKKKQNWPPSASSLAMLLSLYSGTMSQFTTESAIGVFFICLYRSLTHTHAHAQAPVTHTHSHTFAHIGTTST